MVAEALEVPRGQGDVDDLLRREVVVAAERLGEGLLVQAVEQVVVVVDGLRHRDVAGLQDRGQLARDTHRARVHLLEEVRQGRRDHRMRVPQSRDLGEVARQVAHALEARAHPQRRDDGAQVAGHRLLLGDEEHAPLVEVLLQGVDRAVGVDDPLGQRQVTREQRAPRLVDGDAHLAAHGGQVGAERSELGGEHFPHLFPLVSVRLRSQGAVNTSRRHGELWRD